MGAPPGTPPCTPGRPAKPPGCAQPRGAASREGGGAPAARAPTQRHASRTLTTRPQTHGEHPKAGFEKCSRVPAPAAAQHERGGRRRPCSRKQSPGPLCRVVWVLRAGHRDPSAPTRPQCTNIAARGGKPKPGQGAEPCTDLSTEPRVPLLPQSLGDGVPVSAAVILAVSNGEMVNGGYPCVPGSDRCAGPTSPAGGLACPSTVPSEAVLVPSVPNVAARGTAPPAASTGLRPQLVTSSIAPWVWSCCTTAPCGVTCPDCPVQRSLTRIVSVPSSRG